MGWDLTLRLIFKNNGDALITEHYLDTFIFGKYRNSSFIQNLCFEITNDNIQYDDEDYIQLFYTNLYNLRGYLKCDETVVYYTCNNVKFDIKPWVELSQILGKVKFMIKPAILFNETYVPC